MASEQLFLKSTVTSKTVAIAKTLLASKQMGTKAPLACITRDQIFNDIAKLWDCTYGSHMPGHLPDINGPDNEQATEMPFEVIIYPKLVIIN